MSNTDDIQKMLRMIINGQSRFRQEILIKFDKIEQKIEKLDKKIDSVEKRLTDRIDTIGKQLAYLEDDTPTREEFDNLAKKVDQIDQKVTALM